MWAKLAHWILRNRVVLIIILALITAFMGYQASKIQLSYELVRPLPKSDQALIDYENFKKTFGEDGNVFVIGFKDKNFFTLEKFNDWYRLGNEIKKIDGIKDVLSVAKLYNIVRNDSLKRFDFKPIVPRLPRTQQEVDSIHRLISALPFYEGLAINSKTGATLMTITFDNKKLNSKGRINTVDAIKAKVDLFGQKHHLQMHYSGMPYIRTVFMRLVSSELILFLILAIAVTAAILLLFFRSFRVMAYSMFAFALDCLIETDTLLIPEILRTFSITARQVCEGQQYDMEFETAEKVTIADYLMMIRLKTAVLPAASFKIGAIIAGAEPQDAENIYRFGENIGLAFQLKDDLLDVFGNEATFGKHCGGDITSNKKTFLYLKAFELATGNDRLTLQHYFGGTDFNEEIKYREVKRIYENLKIKDLAEKEMDKYYHQSLVNLDAIAVEEGKKAELKQFAQQLMKRES